MLPRQGLHHYQETPLKCCLKACALNARHASWDKTSGIPSCVSAGGAVVGYVGGVVMRMCMRYMRLHGSTPDRELNLSLAGAYLTFYIANAPCQSLPYPEQSSPDLDPHVP